MKSGILELKRKGIFYEAKHESAYILWYLLGYKVIDSKVGFPKDSLPKVLNTLEEHHVFAVVKNGNMETKYCNGKNNFEEVLDRAKKKYMQNKKIKAIEEKLPKLSNEQIEEIVEFMYSI